MGRTIRHDLLVAVARVGIRRGQLQTIQRALARQQRLPIPGIGTLGIQPIPAIAEQGQHRVSTQLVVVVEVFVTERDSQYALADQGPHRVPNAIGFAVIGKAPAQVALRYTAYS